MSYLPFIFAIGVGATAVMDLWSLVRRRLLNVPLPNYGLVGRWIGHMAHGRFHHDSIAASAQIRGELAIGWLVHYLTGIAFAVLLVGTTGIAWPRDPTLLPALVVGVCTVAAPFLLMQPGMGAGIAATRTANPVSNRVQSFITHAVFGLGLYLSGRAVHLFSTI